MGSNVEAKSICVHKLEDLLLEPMFTIFHVQHSQIAAKTETKNSLIYHLKCSMAKVRHWNSQTVRDFCANLVTRFPALGEAFPHLFGELQELTCKILNDSSESSSYIPVREELHTFIHSFISACSDAFISHTHWFAVEESSTEYQSCKNNAKVRMQQANVVENTVMNFVRRGPRISLPYTKKALLWGVCPSMEIKMDFIKMINPWTTTTTTLARNQNQTTNQISRTNPISPTAPGL